MSLLVKAKRDGTGIVRVTPESAGWKYVGFEAFRLGPSEQIAFESTEHEFCVVVLSGTVSVESDGEHWKEIGERKSVFERVSPYAVYLSRPGSARVIAHDNAEVALARAPAKSALPPRLIEPKTMKRFARGEGLNQRFVCDILPQTEPAEHLLVVEVITPGGHTSSYPPHKHDQDNLPAESFLEETYYHRVNPPQGFAFQRVYTDDRSLDEAIVVEDGSVVMVPKGYHPVAAIHGYDLYYLNVMAGPRRTWKFHNAREHEWLMKP